MILYKYLEPARIDVLQGRRIRFTQPRDFNDPFEFRPRIDSAVSEEQMREYVNANFEQLLEQELEKYGELVRMVPKSMLKQLLLAQKDRLPELFRLLEPEMIGKVTRFLDGYLSDNVGVLCLSEIRDSILMWGHYTQNHRGFAVGFDANHSFFSQRRGNEDEFGFLRQVRYQRQRPNVVLADTSSEVWFQTKSEHWSYEKEWRILRVLADADSRVERMPFPICLFEFPPDAVAEIIVGMQSPESLTQEIRSLASAFPRATVLKAREDPSDYALIVDGLD